VRRRLDDIASQTMAHIAVVNSPLSLSNRTPPDGISSSAGWSGLETERICELVITGHGDSVELARVRLLVMLDELVSFFSCDSDPRKLRFPAERLACRGLRDRPQVACYHSRTETSCGAIYTRGDRNQYIFPVASTGARWSRRGEFASVREPWSTPQ
jgi:hypothetical protein